MRTDSRIISSIIFLMIAVLIIAGCDGSQQAPAAPESQDDAAQQPAQETQGNTAPEQKQETKTEPVKTLGKTLKDVLSGKTLKYSADYDITAEGTTMSMSMFYDLPKFANKAMAQGTESWSIFDGTDFVSCSKNQGEWSCLKIDVQMPDSEKTEKDIQDGKITTTYLGTCSVAGETGSKYSMEGENYEGTVCYTSDGILLESSTSKPAVSSMTATKVSRSVDASVFVAPAEPKSMEELTQGYQLPEGYDVPSY